MVLNPFVSKVLIKIRCVASKCGDMIDYGCYNYWAMVEVGEEKSDRGKVGKGGVEGKA